MTPHLHGINIVLFTNLFLLKHAVEFPFRWQGSLLESRPFVCILVREHILSRNEWHVSGLEHLSNFTELLKVAEFREKIPSQLGQARSHEPTRVQEPHAKARHDVFRERDVVLLTVGYYRYRLLIKTEFSYDGMSVIYREIVEEACHKLGCDEFEVARRTEYMS